METWFRVTTSPPSASHPVAESPSLVAVVDIGSNSVRMVVYQGTGRAPVPVFNERTLCALGKTLGKTGRLYGPGVLIALDHLRRFAAIGHAMGVGRWEVLATEAVRSARDGGSFVEQATAILGCPIHILSGDLEAEASALGVIAGIPGADGLTGDLGGGSLELVALDSGRIGKRISLPLGALRLKGEFGNDIGRARRHVERVLGDVGWLEAMKGRTLYPVGGSWRAFAHVHMNHTNHPLHVVHGYRLPMRSIMEVLHLVSRLGQKSLARIPGVPKARLSTLHLAAIVLETLITAARPSMIEFSANGLREGWLFRSLDEATRARDPLLAAARDLAAQDRRFPSSAQPLSAWIRPLFPDETPEQARLRDVAACLSDVGWRIHPDSRADDAFLRVLHLPFTGLDHRMRVMLAFAIAARYGGGGDNSKSAHGALISAEDLTHAQALGRALRFALSLSGGANALFEGLTLRLTRKSVILNVRKERDFMIGDAARHRFDQLARRLGRRPRIMV